MTKILFISSYISGGGAVRVMQNIINTLSPKTYKILLVITLDQNKEIDNTINKNVSIIYLNKKRSIYSINKIFKIIRNFQPAYIFCTDYNAYFLPIFKIIFNKIKIVSRVNLSPSEYPKNNLKTYLYHKFLCFSFKHTDLIISQTDFMKNDIIKTYKLKGSNVKTIPNIINPSFLDKMGMIGNCPEFNSNDYNILAVGYLYPIKGFDLLIEAMGIVRNKINNFKLVIIGGERYYKDYDKYLQAKIIELNLDNNILLLGEKSNPYPYFKNADLFVLSSLSEGFPNVVLESLYFGTPVVATNVVDFSNYIFEGINGYVVQKKSSKSLANGIINAFNTLNKNNSIKFNNYDYSQIFK